jgi:diaminopropionate ammonia-lyase
LVHCCNSVQSDSCDMIFVSEKKDYAPPRSNLLRALGSEGRSKAAALLSACPRATPTPLYDMKAQARVLGIGSLHIKDEGQRLGLGSFKALGGAYAVMTLVLDAVARRLQRSLLPSDLLSSDVKAIAASMTMSCATDGNHGRSVAAGARIAGCRCVIFVHRGVSGERAAAIARYGAEVRRTAGSYDDSVREAAATAQREGWTIVSDTSWQGYEDIPLTVMQGYTVMAGEAFDALSAPPTHIFLQAGVGGLAAAVSAHAQAIYGAAMPKIVIVEPARAACLFASAKAGRLTEVPHDKPTVMGMLECYSPSALAWEILAPIASGYVTLEEDEAVAVMKRLAFPIAGDPAIVSGESGGTGLAGLISCLNDGTARTAFGLGSISRVLVFNSEGATDPGLYEQLVGTSATEIADGRS